MVGVSSSLLSTFDNERENMDNHGFRLEGFPSRPVRVDIKGDGGPIALEWGDAWRDYFFVKNDRENWTKIL